MSTPVTTTSPQGATIGRFYAAADKPKKISSDQTILAKIIDEYKNLNRKQIDTWRQALRAAKDPYRPRWYALQDLYDDLETDGHYKSQFQLRDMATLGYAFDISDDVTGDPDPETTKLFRSAWFYRFMKFAISLNRKGYAVLELIDPVTMTFKMIPRRNVVPSKKLVLKQVFDDDSQGIYYGEGFEDRIIEIGDPDDLGITNDIIPQLIWKRNSQQSWAEFSEKFGMPMIVATSNKTNAADLDKIQAILDALGEAARAVLPAGNTIDIKPFAGTDSYQVYDQQIERCNSEISKPIVGGTMTTDNGSSRSQSEVHERNLDDKIAENDRTVITFLVNDKLIPMMRLWGWNVPENRTFSFSESFDMDLSDHWTIVSEALQFYNIPVDWISKTFNFPIDSVKTVTPPVDPSPEDPAPPAPPVDPKKVKLKGKPSAGFFG